MTTTMVKPCGKCGNADRNPGGACKHCAKIKNAQWRKEHQEIKKAADKKWAAENPDRVKANKARYAERHKEELKVRYKKNAQAWQKANPEKVKEIRRKFESENVERMKIVRKAWRLANKEKVKATQAKTRAKNLEKCKQAQKRWMAEHPERNRIYTQNRNARKKANGGQLSHGLVEKLFKLQNGKCPCCKQPLGDDFELDHRMPLALGGAHEDSNMQLLRAACNQSKHMKHPVDFMQSRGFLL